MVHSRKLGKPSFVIGVCEPVTRPEDAAWILGSLKAGQQWWNTSGKQTRSSGCFSSYLNKTHWLLICLYIEITIKYNGPISPWHCLPLGITNCVVLGLGRYLEIWMAADVFSRQ